MRKRREKEKEEEKEEERRRVRNKERKRKVGTRTRADCGPSPVALSPLLDTCCVDNTASCAQIPSNLLRDCVPGPPSGGHMATSPYQTHIK